MGKSTGPSSQQQSRVIALCAYRDVSGMFTTENKVSCAITEDINIRSQSEAETIIQDLRYASQLYRSSTSSYWWLMEVYNVPAVTLWMMRRRCCTETLAPTQDLQRRKWTAASWHQDLLSSRGASAKRNPATGAWSPGRVVWWRYDLWRGHQSHGHFSCLSLVFVCPDLPAPWLEISFPGKELPSRPAGAGGQLLRPISNAGGQRG